MEHLDHAGLARLGPQRLGRAHHARLTSVAPEQLGVEQVEQLDARLAARTAENIFVWVHHPPINLMGPHGFDAPFLEADIGVLHHRHGVRGIAAGHVHGEHNVHLGEIPVHATPSTFMVAGGPGYRIVDFTADVFTTTVRSWPERSTMTDAKRDTLVANLGERKRHQPVEAVARGVEAQARAHVLEWFEEAERRRGHPVAAD